MIRFGVIILFLACALSLPTGPWFPFGPQSALAQVNKPGTKAPYHDEIMRLSEILGVIQYLRTLCGAEDGAVWRTKMLELIKAERPDITQRRRLVARFNSGYRNLAQIYQTCTPAAIRIANRYVEEGANLAGEIRQRYSK